MGAAASCGGSKKGRDLPEPFGHWLARLEQVASRHGLLDLSAIEGLANIVADGMHPPSVVVAVLQQLLRRAKADTSPIKRPGEFEVFDLVSASIFAVVSGSRTDGAISSGRSVAEAALPDATNGGQSGPSEGVHSGTKNALRGAAEAILRDLLAIAKAPPKKPRPVGFRPHAGTNEFCARLVCESLCLWCPMMQAPGSDKKALALVGKVQARIASEGLHSSGPASHAYHLVEPLAPRHTPAEWLELARAALNDCRALGIVFRASFVDGQFLQLMHLLSAAETRPNAPNAGGGSAMLSSPADHFDVVYTALLGTFGGDFVALAQDSLQAAVVEVSAPSSPGAAVGEKPPGKNGDLGVQAKFCEQLVKKALESLKRLSQRKSTSDCTVVLAAVLKTVGDSENDDDDSDEDDDPESIAAPLSFGDAFAFGVLQMALLSKPSRHTQTRKIHPAWFERILPFTLKCVAGNDTTRRAEASRAGIPEELANKLNAVAQRLRSDTRSVLKAIRGLSVRGPGVNVAQQFRSRGFLRRQGARDTLWLGLPYVEMLAGERQTIAGSELLAKLREIFESCDPNHDGRINKRELIRACRNDSSTAEFFGLPAQIRQEDGSRDRFEELFQGIDRNDDRDISWDEFCHYFKTKIHGTDGALASEDLDDDDNDSQLRGIAASDDPHISQHDESVMFLNYLYNKILNSGGSVDSSEGVSRTEVLRFLEENADSVIRACFELPLGGWRESAARSQRLRGEQLLGRDEFIQHLSGGERCYLLDGIVLVHLPQRLASLQDAELDEQAIVSPSYGETQPVRMLLDSSSSQVMHLEPEQAQALEEPPLSEPIIVSNSAFRDIAMYSLEQSQEMTLREEVVDIYPQPNVPLADEEVVSPCEATVAEAVRVEAEPTLPIGESAPLSQLAPFGVESELPRVWGITTSFLRSPSEVLQMALDESPSPTNARPQLSPVDSVGLAPSPRVTPPSAPSAAASCHSEEDLLVADTSLLGAICVEEAIVPSRSPSSIDADTAHGATPRNGSDVCASLSSVCMPIGAEPLGEVENREIVVGEEKSSEPICPEAVDVSQQSMAPLETPPHSEIQSMMLERGDVPGESSEVKIQLQTLSNEMLTLHERIASLEQENTSLLKHVSTLSGVTHPPAAQTTGPSLPELPQREHQGEDRLFERTDWERVDYAQDAGAERTYAPDDWRDAYCCDQFRHACEDRYSFCDGDGMYNAALSAGERLGTQWPSCAPPYHEPYGVEPRGPSSFVGSLQGGTQALQQSGVVQIPASGLFGAPLVNISFGPQSDASRQQTQQPVAAADAAAGGSSIFSKFRSLGPEHLTDFELLCLQDELMRRRHSVTFASGMHGCGQPYGFFPAPQRNYCFPPQSAYGNFGQAFGPHNSMCPQNMLGQSMGQMGRHNWNSVQVGAESMPNTLVVAAPAMGGQPQQLLASGPIASCQESEKLVQVPQRSDAIVQSQAKDELVTEVKALLKELRSAGRVLTTGLRSTCGAFQDMQRSIQRRPSDGSEPRLLEFPTAAGGLPTVANAASPPEKQAPDMTLLLSARGGPPHIQNYVDPMATTALDFNWPLAARHQRLPYARLAESRLARMYHNGAEKRFHGR